ncbi:hypothetical protein BKG56_15410 [Mycobacteroides chelonae]|nr:hypothetical protein GR01_07745 [Mycobacteroides chelonae]OLT75666.1 hypothetical protein BKG56_15410 [Mycobacteroides chelonae]
MRPGSGGFYDLQKAVLEKELCASCGACAAVCPTNVIHVDADEPVPSLVISSDVGAVCGSCTLCLDVCPGSETGSGTSELRIFGRNRTVDERWGGITSRVLIGKARPTEIREAASAGGAATAMLVAALTAGRIDAALVIGRDENRPWVPVPRLVTTVEDIVSCAQANYCITPNLQLLGDTAFERVGVVGLPCQIQAIQKMRNLDALPPAALKVALLIEIACSSNTRRAGTEHLIKDRLSVPLTDVTGMRYRSGNYPGQFTAWRDNADPATLPFHELVRTFTAFKTRRCLVCPDWWSGLADVSVADGDPNIFKTSRSGEAADATSLVVTRTEAGDDLVDLAVSAATLDVFPAEFAPEKNLGLQRKRQRYNRHRRADPSAVPNPPSEEAVEPALIEDAEVIDRLSQ